MDARAKQLLDNLLDSFDRLYDESNQVVDVQALLVATAAALPTSDLSRHISRTSITLFGIMRSGETDTRQRELALIELQHVRESLARLL